MQVSVTRRHALLQFNHFKLKATKFFSKKKLNKLYIAAVCFAFNTVSEIIDDYII